MTLPGAFVALSTERGGLSIYGSDDWRRDSLCQEYPDVDFFPSYSKSKDVEKAKKVCRGCLVKTECLEYAYTTKQPEGIWGGFTMPEVLKVGPFIRMRAQLTVVKDTPPKPMKDTFVSYPQPVFKLVIGPTPFVLRVP